MVLVIKGVDMVGYLFGRKRFIFYIRLSKEKWI